MPVTIAITADRRAQGPIVKSNKIRPPQSEIFLKEALVTSLKNCGADVILLPPDSSANLVQWVLKHCDGVVVSGGAFDIDPSWYGQETCARIDHTDEGRTQFEIALIQECIAQDIPLLGICGGMQAMAVATGGTLIQDISTQIPNSLEHEQLTDPKEGWHEVAFCVEHWQSWFGTDRIQVNSTHHQAVLNLGRFQATGYSKDGIVECFEDNSLHFCVGVQWHPELLDTRIFQAFIKRIQDKS